MESDLLDFSLVNLYEGESSDILDFLNSSLEETDKWSDVIHNHIKRVLHSERYLKVETLGTGLSWLNTEKPLSLTSELKDRIIVLDFFTYCCVNCEHALPFIKKVETEFKTNPALVVIGVHSPKFTTEKALHSVKNAVLRNKIEHPVINDPDNFLWNELGVYCWPTVLILSPDHRVLFSLVGESCIEKLNYLCHQTMNYFTTSNIKLNTSQLLLSLLVEPNSIQDSLLYPSGISTHDNLIIISDTGHNRLLLVSNEGNVLDVIGNGSTGNSDGFYVESSFNRPNGTAFWNSHIVFVADTGNHCIRMIDLVAKEVSTVFKGGHFHLKSAADGLMDTFYSPWDVCLGPKLGSDMSELNVLYIAVAGSHQIWCLDLNYCQISVDKFSALKCTPFSGNGKEECRNNSYKMKAGFAQPSGLSYSKQCPGNLFIADSESSTVRSISLLDGIVKTVVGGGLNPEDLFQYGDEDGVYLKVKLQHPLGICAVKAGRIFITDTYNHKIKVVNDKTKECSSLVVDGTKSNTCLKTNFNEPSGICYSSKNGLLYVTDTNNHCVKMIDPERKTIDIMPVIFPNSSCVDGLQSSVIQAAVKPMVHQKISLEQNLNSSKITLYFGGKINCFFKLIQPGISLTKGSLQPWDISTKGNCNWKMSCVSNTLFDLSVQPALILQCFDESNEEHYSEVTISVNLTVCDDINKTCMPKTFNANFSIEFSSEGCKTYDAELFL